MDQNVLSSGLTKVRARFLDALCERLHRIKYLRIQLVERIDRQGALCEIGQICHKIAGTAATLGFPELGAESAAIDDLIMADIIDLDTTHRNLLSQIDQLLSIMEAVVLSHKSDAKSSFSRELSC